MITVLSLSPAVDKIYYIENFQPGGLYRVKNVLKSAGGKGINVARVASILGAEVSLLGFKAGETGEWLEKEIKKENVSVRFIRVNGESRTNNNIIDKLSMAETEVLEVGPFINQMASEEFLRNFDEVLGSTDVLVCSGGLPDGISKGFYRTLIEIAKKSDVKVILDTSNEVLIEGLKARPNIIKPNLRELCTLAGKSLNNTEEIVDACKKLIADGIERVAASLGADGAILVTENTVIRAFVPKINAVNTIGSGDSLVAGLAFGMDKKMPLEEMFKLSVACAVSNTQHDRIGFVETEEVKKYLKEIKIEEL